jgi:hypothetical protein
LVAAARKERIGRIKGHIMAENTAMRRVSEEVGFRVRFDQATGEWGAEIAL